MDEQRVQNVAEYFRAQDTQTLRRLYDKGGHSAEGFEALRRLLTERQVSLPAPPLKAGRKGSWLRGLFGVLLPSGFGTTTSDPGQEWHGSFGHDVGYSSFGHNFGHSSGQECHGAFGHGVGHDCGTPPS
jgi:hypothetical protein